MDNEVFMRKADLNTGGASDKRKRKHFTQESPFVIDAPGLGLI